MGKRNIKGSGTPAKPPADSDVRLNSGPERLVENTSASVSSRSTIYFWKETDELTGYLCQWYPCPFTDAEGKVYKTAEHYMMHNKALVFGDEETSKAILKAGTPRKAKALGRQVQNLDPSVWEARRKQVVCQGNYFKFTRAIDEHGLRLGASDTAPLVGMSLRQLLMSTGDRELVEASPFDRVWGIGFTASDAGRNRDEWGTNLLGKALMEVRARLREEDEERKD